MENTNLGLILDPVIVLKQNLWGPSSKKGVQDPQTHPWMIKNVDQHQNAMMSVLDMILQLNNVQCNLSCFHVLHLLL